VERNTLLSSTIALFTTEGVKWGRDVYVLSKNQHVRHSAIGLEWWNFWLTFWKSQTRFLAGSQTDWYFCGFSLFLQSNTVVVYEMFHAISESLFLSLPVISVAFLCSSIQTQWWYIKCSTLISSHNFLVYLYFLWFFSVPPVKHSGGIWNVPRYFRVTIS